MNKTLMSVWTRIRSKFEVNETLTIRVAESQVRLPVQQFLRLLKADDMLVVRVIPHKHSNGSRSYDLNVIGAPRIEHEQPLRK